MRRDKVFQLLVNSLPISIPFIICILITFTFYRCSGRSARTYVNEAGYYCKYCHQGVSVDYNIKYLDTLSSGVIVRGNLDPISKPYKKEDIKTMAINKLGDHPCPCSKDHMHKLKWYRHNPVNKL